MKDRNTAVLASRLKAVPRFPLVNRCIIVAAFLTVIVIILAMATVARGNTQPPNLIARMVPAPKLMPPLETLSYVMRADPGTTFSFMDGGYTSAFFYARDDDLVRIVFTSIVYPERTFVLIKPDMASGDLEDVINWKTLENFFLEKIKLEQARKARPPQE